jgi:hypothetical protein
MEKLLNKIRLSVKTCEALGEPPDRESWERRQGILLTPGEGRKLLLYIEKLEKK